MPGETCRKQQYEMDLLSCTSLVLQMESAREIPILIQSRIRELAQSRLSAHRKLLRMVGKAVMVWKSQKWQHSLRNDPCRIRL